MGLLGPSLSNQTPNKGTNMNTEQLLARVAELEAKLNSQASGGIKVSDKGAVSVYGLGRFPVTLYKTQWVKLQSKMPEVMEFIQANESRLATKE